MTNENQRTLTIFPFLIVGIVAGALIAWLSQHIQWSFIGPWWQPKKTMMPPLSALWMTIIGWYSFMFLIAYPLAQSVWRLMMSTLIASVFASLPYYYMLQIPPYDAYSFMLCSAFAWNAFNINYQMNRLSMVYTDLFYAVWDTIVKCLMALFFTLLCWIILAICAELFAWIHITSIYHLISSNWFIAWSTAVFMSVGIYIPSRFAHATRNIGISFLMQMCRYLFIPLAIISITFLIFFFISFIQKQVDINKPGLFFLISFLCVVFFNGVYQDGSNEKPYPFFLMVITRIFLVVTPIFTMLALYSITCVGMNNVKHYGLNLLNFYDVLNASMLLLYNLTYLISAIHGKPTWFKSIARYNIILAILLMVITLIATLPWVTKQIPLPHYFWPNPINSTQNTTTSQAMRSIVMPTVKTPPNNINFGSWITQKNNTIPGDAFVVGENNGPLYLCQSVVNGAQKTGVVRKQHCVIASNDQVISASHFTVYAQPPAKVYWSTYYPLANRNKRVEVDSKTHDTVCRTIYNNRVYVGVYNFATCDFVADNKVIHSQDRPQFLYVNES